MKQYDIKKAKKRLIGFIQRCNLFKDFEYDPDSGRMVLFTDLFYHTDGTIWDTPEEEDEDNFEIVEEVITFEQLGKLAQLEEEMKQASEEEKPTVPETEPTNKGDN